jgi:coproporphyrinogen III oxidase-like Fe-S oxidoreductase
VPFCESLCPFCSFHRVQFREDKARGYFEALRQEITSYHARGFSFGDVYVGGGTPTILPEELVRTLELIRSLWPVRTISVETNPNHLNDEVLSALKCAGVGRLSVGVQSFDDELLKQMQRYGPYGSGAAIRARLAHAQGCFRTLNVDMMFNFPQQTRASLEQDLATLLALRVDQVSFYPLMTAPSARRKMQQTFGAADGGHTYQYYERILAAMGPEYEPSSAWCFSRRARDTGSAPMIDEYITDTEDYVGVGSGSFSYVNGWMHSTTFSLNQYRERLAAGLPAITRSTPLGLRERMRYDFLVRLFGMSLPYDYMRRKYGAVFWVLMAPELTAMRLLNATRHDRDAIRLTPLGMYVWVLMMAEFFNSVNAFRDEMRLHIREELESGAVPGVRIPLAAAAAQDMRRSSERG